MHPDTSTTSSTVFLTSLWTWLGCGSLDPGSLAGGSVGLGGGSDGLGTQEQSAFSSGCHAGETSAGVSGALWPGASSSLLRISLWKKRSVLVYDSMSSFHLEISLLPSNTIGITFHCQSIFFFMWLFRSTNRRLRLHRIPIFIFQCDRLSKERTWGDKASMQPKEVCLVPVALRSLSNPHPVHLMH